VTSRRLDPRELQGAFARGPRKDLEFLVPSREPAPATPPPEPAKPKVTKRRTKKKAPEPETVIAPETETVTAPETVTVTEPVTVTGPAAETVSETATVRVARIAFPDEAVVAPRAPDEAWSPASPPWPQPRLLDRVVRRLELVVARVLFG
jgi:hypothetical protein